jgi:small GTP-binding protein
VLEHRRRGLFVPKEKPIKLKICLIGESCVGKTSLIKRFVFDQFDDEYICTIGTKITKKEIKVSSGNGSGEKDIHLMIWDIIGHQGFRQLLQQAYFFGTHGLIGVCDITREETLDELRGWMKAVRGITDDIPTIFLGNKSDLEDDQQVDISDLETFASEFEKSQAHLSSAKTGYNVDNIFNTLGQKILEDSRDV